METYVTLIILLPLLTAACIYHLMGISNPIEANISKTTPLYVIQLLRLILRIQAIMPYVLGIAAITVYFIDYKLIVAAMIIKSIDTFEDTLTEEDMERSTMKSKIEHVLRIATFSVVGVYLIMRYV